MLHHRSETGASFLCPPLSVPHMLRQVGLFSSPVALSLCMQVATVSGLVEDLANRTITLEDVISMNLQDSMTLDAATSRKPMHAIVKKLGAYLESRAFSAGDVLFDFGDNADSIIMVLSGSIVTVLDFLSYTEYVISPSIVHTCVQNI